MATVEWQGSAETTRWQGKCEQRRCLVVGPSSLHRRLTFYLTLSSRPRYPAAMFETLRDTAVATMILSQFVIGVASTMTGHFREAAIGTLCAIINILIFWEK